MKLTKREFKAWLEAYYNEDVGVQGDTASCPIANYIYETTSNVDYVTVHPGFVEYRSLNAAGRWYEKKMPGWAMRFVYDVDNLILYDEDEEEEYRTFVYGYDALEVEENA